MKFEYSIELIDPNRTQARAMLNRLGADGWELVAICGATAYFKRLIISSEQKGGSKHG